MTVTDLKQLRLYRQHITSPTDKMTVVRDLMGVQAQFTVNARHALRIRSAEILSEDDWGMGLCKNWTIRGTVHVFDPADLGLFQCDEARYRSRDFRGFVFRDGTWAMTPARQAYWSEKLLSYVDSGISAREDLKAVCCADGMTKAELDCMFDPWGGGIRDLCERGFLCHVVQEKKAFMPAPPYTPMGEAASHTVLIQRYLTSYAPATLRDMHYYFGWTQAAIRSLLQQLPVSVISVGGRDCFFLGALPGDCPDIPACILAAGFDPLMLGYEKKDSIFVPENALRGIFSLQGIVAAPILIDGTVRGKWKYKDGKLTCDTFVPFPAREKALVEAEAVRWFGVPKRILWNE